MDQAKSENKFVTCTVKWFNAFKGFGFVILDDGQDAFLHLSVVNEAGFHTVAEGNILECSVAKSANGWQVMHITNINNNNIKQIEDNDKLLKFEGVVKFFNHIKGFGFATIPDGRDVFIGIIAINRSNLKILTSGQKLMITAEDTGTNLNAVLVKTIE